ncbi:MAG: zinc-dependent metalloprotease [Marinifilaceae bacterium]|jgi:hypothetical protein|nr:zinc-dependent metalloprotease [Marinifilaceae bacterium]
MNKILSLVIFLLLGVQFQGNAQFWKKNKKQKIEHEESEKKSDKTNQDYSKLLKDAITKDGMFKLHLVKDKIYFEIEKKDLANDYMLSSRISKVSMDYNSYAGKMPSHPILFNFDADKEKVYLKLRQFNSTCDKNSEMYKAYQRNNIDAIWKSFDIKAFGADSLSYVFDVTSLFCSSIKELSPFSQLGGVAGLSIKFSGSFAKDKSKIINFKSFEKNVKIRSRLSYTIDGGMPYTVEMTRNLIKLPEATMPIRYADERIGYFCHPVAEYNENSDRLKTYNILHRWDIQPKESDIEKYKAGNLVEPNKQILWYVDTTIPLKWRAYIKKGIEDWNIAFEKIGFKNVMIAKDYPTKEEDPNFDPDDISYNCYRYIATPEKNSQGPSWIDPRSGEIISASVMFYSNVTELLHDWRFIQTATVDPRVRKENLDDEIMGESLRNVAAHEIGHTLGLMHNFGASNAYPVDSLRSANFTKKYGTTPSIMDYARYNYIAQPGDFEKGVSLTPPILGVYDIFSIKWGYKPIFEAKNPKQEYDKLNEWILEKKDDSMYQFGEQRLAGYPRANDLSEDLGDDVLKASKYGIKNLKLLVSNLEKWTMKKNQKYDYLVSLHRGITAQYQTYIMHMLMSIGGTNYRNNVYGDGIVPFSVVDKDEQRRILKYVLQSIYEYPEWIKSDKLKYVFGPEPGVMLTQTEVFNYIMGKHIAHSLNKFEIFGIKDTYSYREFSNDVFDFVWKKSVSNKRLSLMDMNFQLLYVEGLINLQSKDRLFVSKKSSKRYSFNTIHTSNEEVFDYHKMISLTNQTSFANNMTVRAAGSSILYDNLIRTKNLLAKLIRNSRGREKGHYSALYQKLSNIIM